MTTKPTLFLIRWSTSRTLLTYKIAQELKKTHQIRYWIRQRGNPPPDRNEFPETIFQTSKEALHTFVPAEVDASSLEPAGREVFDALRECEAVVYSMMDRIDFENSPFYKRRRLYQDLVNYWYGIFKMMKPDAILFDSVPHIVFDYVIYSLAKYLDVKTAMIVPGRVRPRYMVLTDYTKESNALLRELSRINGDIRPEDLTGEVQKFYLDSVSKGNFAYPLREKTMAEGKEKNLVHLYIPSARKVIRAFHGGDAPRKIVHYTRKMLFGKSNLMAIEGDYRGLRYEMKLRKWARARKAHQKEYEALMRPVDWTKKFLFVPLQYQPECSTCPEGGIFVDQILMLRLLSSVIPKDWTLYVKEHMVQWASAKQAAHLGRRRGYYKELVSLGNVQLISSHIQPDKLMDHSCAIATVTGTVALEAVVRGKPALVFGHRYQGCTEMFHVSDTVSCKAAIKGIQEGYVPDRQKVLRYLAAFDRASLKEWKEDPTGRPRPTGAPGAAERVAQRIIEELDAG